MLACQRFATCFADVTRDTQDKARMLSKAMEKT